MVDPAWRREHERLAIWASIEVPEWTRRLRTALGSGDVVEMEEILEWLKRNGIEGNNPYV